MLTLRGHLIGIHRLESPFIGKMLQVLQQLSPSTGGTGGFGWSPQDSSR